ncbi:MAG: FkbM family methyltransferase [Halioglobus sp.]
MIDVGAHFGGSLAPFAEHGWKVFAFEPDPDNRAKLESGFANMPNVIIDDRAISDQPGKNVAFFASKVSTGISGLSAFHESHEEIAKVSVTTLAMFLAEQPHDNQTIDFLKIDTEGFDLSVLKSVPWDDVQPRMILCEFEDFKTRPLGYDYHDLADYLVDKGYSLVISEWYPIERYGIRHKWRCFSRYPSNLCNSDAWGNIIATKDTELYAALQHCCQLNKG